MEILVAEDEAQIAELYKIALEDRGHSVQIESDGEKAVNAYMSAFRTKTVPNKEERIRNGTFPFDALVLDYRMPKKDGLTVAKEVLEVNPHQRIIFASAYVRETLVDSVKNLKQIVELLQKPFDLETLVDTIEDKKIYEELAKINVKIKSLKELNPTHEQLRDLLEGIKILHKNSTAMRAAA
ncbi:MAG: response regulator [Nitrososphaera sp.]|jgi:CheY-like chemotaxis protein